MKGELELHWRRRTSGHLEECWIFRELAPLNHQCDPRSKGHFKICNVIASRPSMAKIKCSICTYRFNSWYVLQCGTSLLNGFLVSGVGLGACSVRSTHRPGIAVPPGTVIIPMRFFVITGTTLAFFSFQDLFTSCLRSWCLVIFLISASLVQNHCY